MSLETCSTTICNDRQPVFARNVDNLDYIPSGSRPDLEVISRREATAGKTFYHDRVGESWMI